MNNVNQKTLNKAARFSLAFLWIFTGLTSVYLSPNIGYQILASANITGVLADIAINAGGILDIMLGVWLIASFKIKVCCIVQVSVIALYTILLTFIDAGFWLHPFGPITKNIPIIVLIGYLYASHVNSVQS